MSKLMKPKPATIKTLDFTLVVASPGLSDDELYAQIKEHIDALVDPDIRVLIHEGRVRRSTTDERESAAEAEITGDFEPEN